MFASAAMGAGEPLFLDWGPLDTGSAEQQAMASLLRSSVPAPVIQRLSRRETAPWLVQFSGVIREGEKAALEEAGGVIKGYIPENGFIVEAAPAAIMKIGTFAEVAWIGEYLPAYKASRPIREWQRSGGAEARECDVLLFDSRDRAHLVREFGEMPGASVSRSEDLAGRARLRVWLSPEQAAAACGWGEVEWIDLHVNSRWWSSPAPAPAVPDGPESLLREAYDQGKRIFGVGWGCADSGRYGMDALAMDLFTQAHPDMLVVAAAGNSASDTKPADGVVDAGSVGSPATAKNVLAVGAAEGRQDAARTWRDSWPEDFAVEPIALDRMAQASGLPGIAAFSGRGPCADGRIKPDLVAPGTFVPAPRPPLSADTGWGVAADTNFIFTGGTGVAAEQVAAAAAAARAWLAGEHGLKTPSAALVKALLLSGARDLAPGQYGAGAKQEIPDVRPNNVQGFGRLAFPPPGGEDYQLHDRSGLAAGQTDDFVLNVDKSGRRLILVLAYMDCAAAPAAGRKLVNDLDLTVQMPAGDVLRSNGRMTPDAVNNVEMIEFEADEPGTYTVRVAARTVPMGGSQPYALVIRGFRMNAAAAAAMEQP